jgi:hypothetical protein
MLFRDSVYLICWYKSTNNDAATGTSRGSRKQETHALSRHFFLSWPVPFRCVATIRLPLFGRSAAQKKKSEQAALIDCVCFCVFVCSLCLYVHTLVCVEYTTDSKIHKYILITPLTHSSRTHARTHARTQTQTQMQTQPRKRTRTHTHTHTHAHTLSWGSVVLLCQVVH